LGFEDSQILSFAFEFKDRGPGLKNYFYLQVDSDGESTAGQMPILSLLMPEVAHFFYMPVSENLQLTAKTNVINVETTPEALADVLNTLIIEMNYQYRFRLISKIKEPTFIFPIRIRTYKGRYVTKPVNLFPLRTATNQLDDTPALYYNTSGGRGMVVSIKFPVENPFGFSTFTACYDRVQKKMKKNFVTSKNATGILNTHCIITSMDMYSSRALVHPNRSGMCLVGLFPNEGDHSDPYFPVNRLSSTVSYNTIRFECSTLHTHPNISISNECYGYALCFDVCNFNC